MVNKAEHLLEISKRNYNKIEKDVNKLRNKAYEKALKAANQGFRDISFKVKDTMYIPMLTRALEDEGFVVTNYKDEFHILITWG